MNGDIDELDKGSIDQLACTLRFPFDWSADAVNLSELGHYGRALAPLQAQAERLLDRYALGATGWILGKVRDYESNESQVNFRDYLNDASSGLEVTRGR